MCDVLLWRVLGDVAQLVERGLCKPEVVGSNPIVSTKRDLDGFAKVTASFDAQESNANDRKPRYVDVVIVLRDNRNAKCQCRRSNPRIIY